MMPPRHCASGRVRSLLGTCAWMLLGMGFGQTTLAADLLFDFNSTTTALDSFSSKQHARIGSLTLFVMDDGTHGAELWRTDGTTAGTVLVKDINPGSTGSNATGLTELNGKVVFFADDGTNGIELWVSDGTHGNLRLRPMRSISRPAMR